jgi:hypothetical protein
MPNCCFKFVQSSLPVSDFGAEQILKVIPQRSPLAHMNRIGRRTIIMCVLLIRCFGICSANSRQSSGRIVAQQENYHSW